MTVSGLLEMTDRLSKYRFTSSQFFINAFNIWHCPELFQGHCSYWRDGTHAKLP